MNPKLPDGPRCPTCARPTVLFYVTSNNAVRAECTSCRRYCRFVGHDTLSADPDEVARIIASLPVWGDGPYPDGDGGGGGGGGGGSQVPMFGPRK